MPEQIKWTHEQEEAICHKGKAAIVSAAAGSGKTAVLVERVKRLLTDETDRVDADKLVIVTFTNDAAAELKERLNRTMDAAIEADPTNEYLIRQRLALEDAYISTISSFCLDLLRRNSAEAGLRPGFTILDETEAQLIYNKAMDHVLEEFCESGDPDTARDRDMLYDWFFGETDERIVKAIDTLYRFSRNIPDADRYFDSQLAMYRDPDDLSPEAATMLDTYITAAVSAHTAALRELNGQLSGLVPGTPAEELPEQWAALIGIAESITDAQSCRTVYETTLKNTEPPAVPRKNMKIGFDNTDIKALCDKKMSPEYKALLSELAVFLRRGSDMKKCAPILQILVALMRKLEAEYSARKRELGRVDFSDLELMTLKLLRDENGGPSGFARETAANIDIIIVDEFQDSNSIQYEIFRLISRNKKNLYFVGDIKQSIYRFRNADPSVFASLTRDPDFDEIPLNKNFRSCGAVIDAANAIFTGQMTRETGDVDYDETCALVQGNMSFRTDEENITELVRCEGKNGTEARIKEANYIAWRIKQLVGSFKVNENGAKRPCRYGDIAVLMGRFKGGRMSYIDIYKTAFDRAGIPYEAKDSEEYTDFSEVKRTLALLRVIDDPYRNNDLAAVLMSEPYMLTAEEMADIKLAGGQKNKYLWDGLTEYSKSHERAADIVRDIMSLRDFAEENSAARVIRRICDESLLMPAVEAAPDGEKKSVNLHKLIHYAESFSGGESASLYDFIKYMEKTEKSKVRLPAAKGAGKSGVVRFLTIHGSKGLEFPVCFVSNLSSSAPKVTSEIICDPKYGIGMKISDTANMLNITTATYNMTANEYIRLETSESMRLLYVAATRAKEKMIFTAPVSRGEPNMHYGWVINSSAVKKGLIKVSVGNAPLPESENSFAEETVPDIPPFTEYKYRVFSDIPAKVTATQVGVKSYTGLEQETDKMEYFFRMPSFLDDKTASKLSGKKRGDAYHKVMEALDFRTRSEDVPAVLERMCGSGRITELERDSVEPDDIAAFLESDLCGRAASSSDVNREFPIFCECGAEELEAVGADTAGIDWTGEEKPFIQGIADMFFVEDGEIVLVDYKTNRHTTEEKLTEEYRGQLNVYARALSEATGMKVKQKLLYSFDLKKEIEIE